ncbi:MAG TPA: hypothetical protein VFY28_02500 [Candidatus Paceibacterota bacterium]|nr:hypothetical protein [Candidatus Paceibacterota bacterium]
MEKVLRTARKKKAEFSRLTAAAAAAAVRITEDREREGRRQRIVSIQHERLLRKRIELACRGVAQLCALAQAPEIQALLSTQGRPIVLFGEGNKLVGRNYYQTTIIYLTMTELMVMDYDWLEGSKPDPQNGPLYLSFPYAVPDALLHSKRLRLIATPYPIDWDVTNHFLGKEGISYQGIRDVLFEILVECADPKKFEAYLLRAL